MRFSVNRSGIGKQLQEKFSAVPQPSDDISGKIRYMHDVVLKIADVVGHEAVSRISRSRIQKSGRYGGYDLRSMTAAVRGVVK